MPDCGWNRQLAVGDHEPIPCSLAIIVDHLLGIDVAGRCAGGPSNSICFFLSDEWRVAPIIGIAAAHITVTALTGRCLFPPFATEVVRQLSQLNALLRQYGTISTKPAAILLSTY